MSAAQKTYNANCHCGAVRFTVTLSPPLEDGYKPTNCNCSICTKNGYLLVYPKKEDVKFSSGFENLGAYLFGEKNKPHRFCKTCGTSILIDFSNSKSEKERERTAVTVRTFEGIEDLLDGLTYHKFDGKAKLDPPYSINKP